MGFCKICTGRRKPGMNIKIVVNLKKDTVCKVCEKHFEIKAHRKRRDKKLHIFISRLSYSVTPSRHGGSRRLLLPISRESKDRKKEAGWLDMEIDGGDFVDIPWSLSRANLNMDVGNIVSHSRCDGSL